MYRILISAFVGVAAFAQTSVSPPEKPPAEVDQALRARVTQFYTLLTNREYRKAENLVAEDTKDYYYDGAKPDIRGFELMSVEYSDRFTHARVIVKCAEMIAVPNFPIGEIKLDIPTLWKIENGDWYVYEEPNKLANPKELQTKIQSAFNQANSAAPPPLPKDASLVTGKIEIDKPEIKLLPGATENIKITSGLAGPVTLQPGYPLKGIETKLDHPGLGTGETTILTLTAGPNPTAGTLYLQVLPTGHTLEIKVDVK